MNDPSQSADSGGRYDGSAGGQHHVEPCGCVYVAIDVPDDQWIGQGWKLVEACLAHNGRSEAPA